ncbi:MAG: hypothetical protein QOE97_2887 [Pseudonocardiales bacterium]|jgi:hypothetical protein|nr:hypothetical protein [Pseudonocardiales bacterium]
MNSKYLKLAMPVAALGAAGFALALPTASAGASTADTNYQATLSALNHSSGSGSIMVMLNGDQATITEHFSGLAATFNGSPYPHVQHIHIKGKGQCPTAAADANGDGVISTTEGAPAYGPIGTTLSTSGDSSPKAGTTLTVAPSGSNADYTRTITLDAATISSLTAGTAVVVVHGLDPATLSAKAQAEKSDLVPSLPLAATSPALCGTLAASQMSVVPGGAPQTGGGSTAGVQDEALLAIGGGMVLAAGGAFTVSRRIARQS